MKNSSKNLGLVLLVWVCSALAVFGQSKPISQLPEATVALDSNVLPIVNGGSTKKIKFANLKSSLNLFNGTWNSLTGKPTFANVATSGDYTDLLNKPNIISTASNGLNLTGNEVKLGGSLSQFTIINTNNNPFQILGNDIFFTFANQFISLGTGNSFYLNFSQTGDYGIVIKPGNDNTRFLIDDTRLTKFGLEYSGNYSSTYSNRSLVDKGYVDGTVITKQNTLVSGTNIKTVGGVSILGSGDIPISGGSGTVSSFAFQNGGGFTGAVINASTTPALTLSLQNANASQSGQLTNTDWNTFNGKQNSLGFTPISNVLNSAQLFVGNGSNVATAVSMSGDATISNTGAVAIANNAVTNAKSAQMVANTMKGNNTGSTANAVDLSVAQVTSLLAVTTPTASRIPQYSTNLTLNSSNFLNGYTTTATAAGTTTLTVASNQQQQFTGTNSQTVVLPVATTLVNGQSYIIRNISTGVVTVQTSGANVLQAMAGNTSLLVTCINTTGGTGTASWNWEYATLNNGLALTNALTSSNILVGNASNIAAPVAMSGGATISNTGVVTLGNAAVTGQALTGLIAGTNTQLATTNTILQAFQNTQAQINVTPEYVIQGAGNTYPVPTFTTGKPLVFIGADFPQSAVATNMRDIDTWVQNKPNAPTSLVASGISNSAVTLTWIAPLFRDETNTNIATSNLLYRVQYKTTASGTWLTWGEFSTLTTQLTGLTASTSYDTRVYAFFDFDKRKILSDATATTTFSTTATANKNTLIAATSPTWFSMTPNANTNNQDVTLRNLGTLATGSISTPTTSQDWAVLFGVQSTGVANNVIVGFRNQSTNNQAFRIYVNPTTTTQISYQAYDNADVQQLVVNDITTSIFDGSYHQVYITKIGTTLTTYVDGVVTPVNSRTLNSFLMDLNRIQPRNNNGGSVFPNLGTNSFISVWQGTGNLPTLTAVGNIMTAPF